MAMEHRKRFRPLFAADLSVRDHGARLYRSLVFPQRRGRRTTKGVQMAVAMIRRLGRKPTSKDWHRIDLKCRPELGGLPELERRDELRKFHHAVRTYLKRHKITFE